MSLNRQVECTVGAMVFNLADEILLLEPVKWDVDYTFPCGHVEFGERLTEAVKREVKEETGLSIYDIQFLMVNELITSKHFCDHNRHFVSHNYTCRTKGRRIKLNNESKGYLWVPFRKALDLNVDPITRDSIEKYLENERGTE